MMKKGFINITLILGVLILIAGGGFILKRYVDHNLNRPTRFNSGGILGAVYTPVFPSSFSDWKEDDIIEEEWANRLEQTIGTTTLLINSSNTTTSLYRLLTDASSIDPGHVHTSSAVSGTISVSKGGTATTTFFPGLVTANGTNALGTLSPAINGQIPISSGTQFVANTLTAGNNINITNGSGTITITGSGINLVTSTSFGDTTISPNTTSSLIAVTTTATISQRYLVLFNSEAQAVNTANTNCSVLLYINGSNAGTLAQFRNPQGANNMEADLDFSYVTSKLPATTLTFAVYGRAVTGQCRFNFSDTAGSATSSQMNIFSLGI